MEEESGVKAVKAEKSGMRKGWLRLFPSAPGGGAQPLRIPRAGTNLAVPGAALRLLLPSSARQKQRGSHPPHPAPQLCCSGCYPRLAVRTVRKEMQGNFTLRAAVVTLQ